MRDAEHSAGEDEAARAFEALREEVATLRRIVEPLPKEWQKRAPVDYSASLGHITKALSEMSRLLAQINDHPALAMTPALHQQIISDSGRVVMRDAVFQLERAAQWAGRVQRELAALVGTARERGQQWKALLITGAAAFFVGLMASPFIARGLPFGLQTGVAAAVMGVNRWEAGSALMGAESPEAWRDLVSAAALLRANRAALEACRNSALKAQKPQSCRISVAAPGMPPQGNVQNR